MQRLRLAAACATLALVPGWRPASAAPGGDWVAYRDAYRSMVQFEKYGGPKSLLQQHLQVVPRAPLADAAGLELLVGASASAGHYPLDATLRTVFPLMRAAYDDNAVLQLRPQAGAFTVRAQVTLVLRPDHVYDSAQLRRGCEQALAYARQLALFGARHCTGVRFIFSKASAPTPAVRAGSLNLAASPGAAFAGSSDASFPVVTYRFGTVPEQLATASTLLAIAPLFD